MFKSSSVYAVSIDFLIEERGPRNYSIWSYTTVRTRRLHFVFVSTDVNSRHGAAEMERREEALYN